MPKYKGSALLYSYCHIRLNYIVIKILKKKRLMHASRISLSKLYILFHSLLWAVSVERRRERQCASAAKRAEAETCCLRIATAINMVMLLLHLEIQITFPVSSGAIGCQACKVFDKTVANGAVVKRSLTALPAKLTSSKTGG